MRRWPRLHHLALATALAVSGCSDAPRKLLLYQDPTAPLEARVESALAQMTLEEKVEQMHGDLAAAGKGQSATPDNRRLGIPGFRMVDGMRGVGVAAGKATTFPVGSARGATFDPTLEELVGQAIGVEARARGYNVLLAPTMNLLRHPRWGRAQETYGEDSFHVGAMAEAFVRGAQREVIASAKHFALNSIEDTRLTVSVNVDERTLREVYLPHFERVVRAGVGSVMAAYNQVNGVYCAQNTHLLADVLHGAWGFDGFVVSDWVLAMHDTVASALAGLDLEMPVPIYYGTALVDAVRAGRVPTTVIDDAVRRILRQKLRFGLVDGRPAIDLAFMVESPEHTGLARRVAEEGLVLLTNQADTLPLDLTTTRRLAVVGSLATQVSLGDTGSSATASSRAVTPLAGIQARAAGVVATLDLGRDVLTADDEVALAMADAAVVVVGLTAQDEGEAMIGAGDRKSLTLSPAHEALVLRVAALVPRTIVVLEGSGPVLVESFVDQVSALLWASYAGVEGGTAVAHVLFGDVNPSGKLPATWPRGESQLPPFVNDRPEVTYDLLHGYRFVDASGADPRFPFGFGRSYTTFSLHDLSLGSSTASADGSLHVTVGVTNTGTREGAEVVQAYVAYPGSGVTRAPRELKGFARVSLAPGETQIVGLDIAMQDLAYWDVTAGAFVVEALTYELAVGTSARELPLRATFSVP